ncbi:hypothetical protein RND71_027735 [Anisodus tanguticus]|uniref:BZIP domain-containing protein n=1 Tax=Anisodus tanguticus TaxID=243964 RepID=A0AAE1RK68_9SOLA|nr:hypothetical protein RND71_027735 [Anisodus tanguticus]
MMFEDPVHYHIPVLEDVILSPTDIHDILSLLQTEIPAQCTSGSETTRSIFSLEERKRRRKMSNRESARRSRFRKKKHLDNLEDKVDRLKVENRELKNRLCVVTHHCQAAQRETDWLILELCPMIAASKVTMCSAESVVPSYLGMSCILNFFGMGSGAVSSL